MNGAKTVKTQGAYSSQGKLPSTKVSVVAFLDILGFKAEMEAAHRAGRGDELLGRLWRSVQRWYSTVQDNDATTEGVPRIWDVKAFTDNLVIGHPIRVSGGEPELGEVVVDVARLQLGLALDGFFVRGGIGVGPLYMDDDIVYGTGLLDAYRQELIAKVPRIVLSPDAAALTQRHLGYYHCISTAPQNDELLRDKDGRLFVNYLGSVWEDQTEDPDRDSLDAHREIVVSKLSQYREQRKIRAKYAWSAQYHNYVCGRIPGGPRHRVYGARSLRAATLEEVYGSIPVALAAPSRQRRLT